MTISVFQTRLSVILIQVALAASFAVSTAEAGRSTYSARDVSVITAPSGQARILLDFALPTELDGQFVLSAFLSAPLPGLVSDRAIDIEVAAITSSWRGGASWTGPWRTPGGDRDEGSVIDVTIEKGATGARLRVNVTDAVRGALSGDVPFHGFLVMPGPANGRVGFDASDRVFLGTMRDAQLDVVHRKLPRKRAAQ